MADLPIVALSGTQLNQTPVYVDDVTGLITVPTILPVNQNHLSTKEYVDRAVAGFITEADLEAAVADLAPQSEILRLQNLITGKATQASLDALSIATLHLTGGTMSGPILYTPAPTDDAHLVNKAYVDALVDSSVGGAMTLAQADARYLQLTGGAVTGPITLPGAPTGTLDAVPKSYVDGKALDPALYVDTAGDTMTGPLYLSMASPPASAEAVNKGYIDGVLDQLGPGAALAPYYASGAIPVHLSRFMARYAAGGTAIIGMGNRGGAGATYDAQVATGSIPFANGQMTFVSGTPALQLANRLDLMGKTILWVMTYTGMSGLPAIWGGLANDTTTVTDQIRFQGTATARLVLQTGDTNSGLTRALTGYSDAAYWGAVGICELQYDRTNLRYNAYRNGVSTGTPAMHDVDTVAALIYYGSDTAVSGFVGTLGEFIVIDDSLPDAAAAKTAARNYLAAAYGVTLG